MNFIKNAVNNSIKKITSIIDAAQKLSISTYINFLQTIPNFKTLTPSQLNILQSLYMNIIAKAKPITLNIIDKNGNSVTRTIPPSSTYPPFFNQTKVPTIVTTSSIENMTSLPTRISNLYRIDNSDLPSKYNLTQVFNTYPIMNQGQCGTCWAYSTVTSLSDAFLVTGLATQNPLLSITNVLGQLNSQCSPGGGAPSTVLSIGKGLKNTFCTNNYNPKASINSIQSTINNLSTNCMSNDNGSMYYASYAINVIYKGPSTANMTNPTTFTPNYPYLNYNNFALIDLQNMIKRHIKTIGPIVCTIGITTTFCESGFYPIDNKCIYFEDYSYTPNDSSQTHNKIGSLDFIGLHAMSVVGWENVTVSGRTNVPCWIIRNSWGIEWGNNGYIYLPMYPYNKDVQIECWDETKSSPYTSSCMFYDTDRITFDQTTPYPEITCAMTGYDSASICTISNKPVLNIGDQQQSVVIDSVSLTTKQKQIDEVTLSVDQPNVDQPNVDQASATQPSIYQSVNNITNENVTDLNKSSSSSSNGAIIGGAIGGIIIIIIIIILVNNSKKPKK